MRGRIRSIKPEVFKDEDLWDLGVETGYPVLQAFEGLWCYADKEGRFEWRPRQLKTDILPYWEGDFSRVLDALTTRGFIVRYSVDGREYGWVRTFRKHQVINNRESESELPPPPNGSGPSPVNPPTRPRVDDASGTREPRDSGESKRKGTEGNGKGTEGNYFRAHARDADNDSVPDYERGAEGTRDLVRDRYAEKLREKTGAIATWSESNVRAVRVIATWLDAKDGHAPKLLDRTLDGFFADARAAESNYPIAFLASGPDKYLNPPKTAAPMSPRETIDSINQQILVAAQAGDLSKCRELEKRRSELEHQQEQQRRRANGR